MSKPRTDFFRPHTEPARTIYDALVAETDKRDGRDMENWIEEERQAVWRAARDWALQHGWRVPTLAEVERFERLAMGYMDYLAQWARGLANHMKESGHT